MWSGPVAEIHTNTQLRSTETNKRTRAKILQSRVVVVFGQGKGVSGMVWFSTSARGYLALVSSDWQAGISFRHMDAYTDPCTHRHTDAHTDTCTHRHMNAHTHMHAHTHRDTCTHRHMYTQTHECTYTHGCTYTQRHMHTQTNGCTQTSSSQPPPLVDPWPSSDKEVLHQKKQSTL